MAKQQSSIPRARHDAPPCPHCGERQTYDEAIPSKPILGDTPGDWVRGKWCPDVRPTFYHTSCRACGERIVWSVTVVGRDKAASWSTAP